jgi:hypothetical protein
MRKWLIEETGEIRTPKFGEYYWWLGLQRVTVDGLESLYTDCPILRITEITNYHQYMTVGPSGWTINFPDCPIPQSSPSDRFDEWNW